MPFFIISILVQLCLVIHIVKTGRNTTWIWVIVMLPLVGSLAYLILEVVPDLTNSRSGKQARTSVEKLVSPNKNLNEALRNFDESDTVENSARLAEECMNKGMFEEARELFNKCLTGIHATEPDLLHGRARCDFELKEFSSARETLDTLIEKNPEYKNQEAHLLYARTLENLGDDALARHEYETLHSYSSGPLASFYYAKFLKAHNEPDKAIQIFSDIVKKSRSAGRHYNDLYKDYIHQAKAEVRA